MRIARALIEKEFLQIVRGPSSIIIAFVLPLISILIYMYGINLDMVSVTMGIKSDDASPKIVTLVDAFDNSEYVNSIRFDNAEEMEDAIVRSKIKDGIIIPNDFSVKLSKGQTADMLVITDGAEVNTAN